MAHIPEIAHLAVGNKGSLTDGVMAQPLCKEHSVRVVQAGVSTTFTHAVAQTQKCHILCCTCNTKAGDLSRKHPGTSFVAVLPERPL